MCGGGGQGRGIHVCVCTCVHASMRLLERPGACLRMKGPIVSIHAQQTFVQAYVVWASAEFCADQSFLPQH